MPDVFLRAVRLFVYEHFVREGGAPPARRVAEAMSVDEAVAREALEELARQRALVLDPDTREVWMAMPFSAVPTTVRVTVGERTWWANCAWDALGIPAMLASRARIEAECPVGGPDLVLEVSPAGPEPRPGPSPEPTLVHFAVPAARWWEDIGFT